MVCSLWLHHSTISSCTKEDSQTEMTDSTALLSHLNSKPIDGAELARLDGWNITDEMLYHFRLVRNAKRDVQRIVHELRRRGHRIESDGRGYWIEPKPAGQERLALEEK